MTQELKFTLITEVYRIGDAIRLAGGKPLLVGGWVRDALMGIPHSKDFDLEVFHLSPAALQKVLSRFGPVHTVGRHFGVLKLTTREAEYDVSVPRRESKIGKGHKHFQVEPDPSMSFLEAASRRDFTINAMGYDFLDHRLEDPYQGRADLEKRLLRHVGPAFGEDPLRVLRAMQFAGRFGLNIPEETLEICRQQDLHELPRERLFEEFKKLLLQSARPSDGLKFTAGLGALPYFPELERLAAQPQRWENALQTVDRAADLKGSDPAEALPLMLAALCQDMEPGPAKDTRAFKAVRLKLPRHLEEGRLAGALTFLERLTNEAGLVKTVALLLDDLHTPSQLNQQRLLGQATPAQLDTRVRRLALRVSIPFLLRLFRAVYPQAEHHDGAAWLEGRAKALEVWEGPPQPLLQGRHLLEWGMSPGPRMGGLVQEAFELQLNGGLASLEAALDWAKARM